MVRCVVASHRRAPDICVIVVKNDPGSPGPIVREGIPYELR
jgi:hypothetical protein